MGDLLPGVIPPLAPPTRHQELEMPLSTAPRYPSQVARPEVDAQPRTRGISQVLDGEAYQCDTSYHLWDTSPSPLKALEELLVARVGNHLVLFAHGLEVRSIQGISDLQQGNRDEATWKEDRRQTREKRVASDAGRIEHDSYEQRRWSF